MHIILYLYTRKYYPVYNHVQVLQEIIFIYHYCICIDLSRYHRRYYHGGDSDIGGC
jgi:hypothetical protein